MVYNWQHKEWPHFRFSLDNVEDDLFVFTERMGGISGLLRSLPEDTRLETLIDIMVAEGIKTSEIEGEFLNRKDVMSSIKKNLGLLSKNESIADKKAEGIGELMTAVRSTFKDPLTKEQLFAWHTMLMRSDKSVLVGKWRTHKEPMQVVSGAMGKQKVHFEAPPSAAVAKEMNAFIKWFNATGPGGAQEIKKGPVRSAIAHLYFESIHPFEDGNGRIGRAIAEKALSQGSGRPVMLSLSRTIDANKKAYYQALEKAQKTIEITGWIKYFLKVVLDAQIESEEQIDFTLKKTRLFDRFSNRLNNRQLMVVKRMMEEGAKGFEGGMNARKYTGITKTSKATATRDMQDLVEKGIFAAAGGGRSTSYALILD